MKHLTKCLNLNIIVKVDFDKCIYASFHAAALFVWFFLICIYVVYVVKTLLIFKETRLLNITETAV